MATVLSAAEAGAIKLEVGVEMTGATWVGGLHAGHWNVELDAGCAVRCPSLSSSQHP
jgi:hypothetical protein